jgi:hypothetical protein
MMMMMIFLLHLTKTAIQVYFEHNQNACSLYIDLIFALLLHQPYSSRKAKNRITQENSTY